MKSIGTREDYKKLLNGKGIIGREGCPFCDQEKMQDDSIWRGKYWFLCYNKYPYSGNNEHIMAIPYDHKIFATDLSSEEWQELWEVHNHVKKIYGEKSYFSFTRETLSNGTQDARSIEHMHTHFLPWKLQGKYLRKMLENQGFPITEEWLKMKVCN